MSAAKLPVVECIVEAYPDDDVGLRAPFHDYPPTEYDLPAVALPWALLEDAEFRGACLARLSVSWQQWGERMTAPYGYCPVCNAPGKMRARGLNGDDICENGHRYKSRDSKRAIPDLIDALAAELRARAGGGA